MLQADLPRVKGTALLSVIDFARRHFGGDAGRRVLEAVPEHERAAMSGMLIPMSWYPLSGFAALLHALDQQYGRGDGTLVFDRGVWSAHDQLNTVLKVFIKVFTPHTVVGKATRIWNRFHTSGEWQIDWIHAEAARCELTGFGIADEAVCTTLRGWMTGLAQMCTTRKVRVIETQCRCRGATSCVFEIYWR